MCKCNNCSWIIMWCLSGTRTAVDHWLTEMLVYIQPKAPLNSIKSPKANKPPTITMTKVITSKNIPEFYILLTVHLDVILVNDQLDALFSKYLFHACTCFEQVIIIRRIKLCQYIFWYNTLYWVTVLCASREFRPDQHTRESPTRAYYTRWCIDTIWSSWWWALVARKM